MYLVTCTSSSSSPRSPILLPLTKSFQVGNKYKIEFHILFVKDDINRVYLRNRIFHVGNIRFNCSTFKFQAQKAVSFLVSHGRPFRTKLDNKLNAIYKTNQCPFKVDLKTTVHFNSCFTFLVCIPFPMQAVQWK